MLFVIFKTTCRCSAMASVLENGAPIEKVQQLAGHADIRTTQLYADREGAARHVQIR